MASYLRRLAAVPRKQLVDSKTGELLDLAYVTPNIIVTSMPTTVGFRSAYRTPAKVLKSYLERNHASNWHIFNFQAEHPLEYQDYVFEKRVTRFPFPDHLPPPFELIPTAVDAIHKYLQENPNNVAVLHCKAGQGRSGTMACAYLIAYENYSWLSAVEKFTKSRMKPWWGDGVSILSQRRYLAYTETWVRERNREYNPSEFPGVEILSVRIESPQRNGIEIAFHEFKSNGAKKAKTVTMGPEGGLKTHRRKGSIDGTGNSQSGSQVKHSIYDARKATTFMTPDIGVTFKLKHPRRLGLMGHSVGLWFNVLFELEPGQTESSCSFDWSELDGMFGHSLLRGFQAFEKVEFLFRLLPPSTSSLAVPSAPPIVESET